MPDPTPTDDVTWLRELRDAALGPPWNTAAGVAWENVLDSVAPSMLAVIEAAERHHRVRGGWCSCGRDEHQCRERAALDAFRAAVREEQGR